MKISNKILAQKHFRTFHQCAYNNTVLTYSKYTNENF